MFSISPELSLSPPQSQAPCWHQAQSEILSKQNKAQQEETNLEEQHPKRWFQNSCETNLPFSKLCQSCAFQKFFAYVFPTIILNNDLLILHFLSWYLKFYISLNNWKACKFLYIVNINFQIKISSLLNVSNGNYIHNNFIYSTIYFKSTWTSQPLFTV